MAQADLQAGRVDQAYDAFRAVIDDSAAVQYRPQAFLGLGQADLQAGRVDQAYDAFRAVIDDSAAVQYRPQAFLGLGQADLQAGRVDQAQDAFRKALALGDRSVQRRARLALRGISGPDQPDASFDFGR